MEVKIWEDEMTDQSNGKSWQILVTPEQYKRGQHYANQYLIRSAEIAENKALWDRLIQLYGCQRDADPDDPDYPCNFIPCMTPTVEGQVASIIEGNIEFSHTTDNPGHMAFMSKYDAAGELVRRRQRFTDYFKDYTREYDLLGTQPITLVWEEGFGKQKRGVPKGFPRIIVPSLMSVLVDGRIKDVKDLQYAEYIIHEIGFQTIGWAKDEYGEEIGRAISKGFNRYDGEDPDRSIDDDETFLLLHVWTRSNKQKNLQLIEMTSDGFILRESDPSKPYYKNVDNEYPFYFSRMIPIIGQFYGYGDGMILKPIQEAINNLADELELAARFSAQSKIVVDSNAQMGGDQLTSNPADIAVCKDPRNNIMVLQGGGINPVVVTFIEFLLREAQRATRFNDIMTGNQTGVSATATQINSQMMQGSVGINDKKSDIARAMEWVDRYSLKLCLEKWDKPFWAGIGHNYAEFVDPNEMMQAPTVVPISNQGILNNLENITEPNIKMPTTEVLYDENDELIKTDIDFDTKVVLGQGIPKGKNDMYNILLGLAQMQVVKDGVPEPLITAQRLKELMEQTLGFKLTSEQDEMNDMMGATIDQASMQQQNPIGQGNAIQTPTAVPSNLMGTVPQVPSGDNRGLVL